MSAVSVAKSASRTRDSAAASIWTPRRRVRLSRRFSALPKLAARALVFEIAVSIDARALAAAPEVAISRLPKLVFAAIESMSERIAWNWVSS
jgi:hypothetical protein